MLNMHLLCNCKMLKYVYTQNIIQYSMCIHSNLNVYTLPKEFLFTFKKQNVNEKNVQTFPCSLLFMCPLSLSPSFLCVL